MKTNRDTVLMSGLHDLVAEGVLHFSEYDVDCIKSNLDSHTTYYIDSTKNLGTHIADMVKSDKIGIVARNWTIMDRVDTALTKRDYRCDDSSWGNHGSYGMYSYHKDTRLNKTHLRITKD
ncbi:MAG: hypothetical protein Q7J54_04890 [Candidatus Woesearchaeota archaeon]|nr:hypothetical protein [Candidatus Woesearchaeota archaeon]